MTFRGCGGSPSRAAVLWNVGDYYGPVGGRVGSANQGVGRLTCHPLDVPTLGVAIDRIGTKINAAAGAGSVVRLGVYADTGRGRPGALLLDTGTYTTATPTTIDGTSTADQEITLSPAFSLAVYAPLVWLAAVVQVATSATMNRVIQGARLNAGGTALANITGTAGQEHTGFYRDSITGALPDPFTPTSSISQPTFCFIRAA